MRLVWAFCMLTLILGANLISRAKFGFSLRDGPLIQPLFLAITIITGLCWAFQTWLIYQRKKKT